MTPKTNAAGEALYVLWDNARNQPVKLNVLESRRSLEDLQATMEYLPMYNDLLPRENGRVQIDESFYSVVTTEGRDPNDGEPRYVIAEKAAKRSTDEIKRKAEDVKRQQLGEYINPVEISSKLVDVIFIMIRRFKGLNLTADEQAVFDDFTEIGLKNWQNRATLKQKIEAIEAGEVPDLQTGYQPKN